MHSLLVALEDCNKRYRGTELKLFSFKFFLIAAQGAFLTGQCHEIFDLRFFRQTISLSPLVHRLKPFRKWIRIREDIRLQILALRYAA
jgi:hypothetical protein